MRPLFRTVPESVTHACSVFRSPALLVPRKRPHRFELGEGVARDGDVPHRPPPSRLGELLVHSLNNGHAREVPNPLRGFARTAEPAAAPCATKHGDAGTLGELLETRSDALELGGGGGGGGGGCCDWRINSIARAVANRRWSGRQRERVAVNHPSACSH